MDLSLSQFYCSDKYNVESHEKKNTAKIPNGDLSLHYTCYLSAVVGQVAQSV